MSSKPRALGGPRTDVDAGAGQVRKAVVADVAITVIVVLEDEGLPWRQDFQGIFNPSIESRFAAARIRGIDGLGAPFGVVDAGAQRQ